MEQFDKERYAIFQNISEENLQTLLTCADAQVSVCAKGEQLLDKELQSSKGALILDGRATAVTGDGRSFTLEPGMLLGKSFWEKAGQPCFTEIVAAEECKLLVMSYEGMSVPCWFSCFFHACFIDNLEKVSKQQMKLLEDQ